MSRSYARAVRDSLERHDERRRRNDDDREGSGVRHGGRHGDVDALARARREDVLVLRQGLHARLPRRPGQVPGPGVRAAGDVGPAPHKSQISGACETAHPSTSIEGTRQGRRPGSTARDAGEEDTVLSITRRSVKRALMAVVAVLRVLAVAVDAGPKRW